MAKKEPNKNKVGPTGAGRKIQTNMFDTEAEQKQRQQHLDTVRKQMEAANITQEQRNKLLADEERQVGEIIKVQGKELTQIKDLANLYDSIYSRQQEQTNAVEQLYGVQNKLADKLQLHASSAQEIATWQRQTRDMSLEELNTNNQTLTDLQEMNRLKMAAVKQAQKLTLFNKDRIPYYAQMQEIQAEIAVLSKTVGDNVDTENAHRLETLKHMKKEYETLGKLEKKNERIEQMQGSINDLMTMQGTAAGTIFNTIKDIVTNPLLIFTGLLALGVQRYETMRQRGNQLAEEMDRVNKKLAGSGPYQDAIIGRARKIHSTFRAAGEGFAGSLESAVDAVQALEAQLGGINHVTSDLVNTMTDLKLSINLSDDEVAKVIDTYLTVDNLSESAAINSAEMLYSMSEQAGLNPAEVFREIANATGETLAHFRGGGQELNKAVISAKRMGLGLEDVAKISKGLLDFETSIEAEMEAQMLTGMNLNFNRARMFAMNKEGAKAAEEVLRQVGGLERYRRMNIFQQEAIAKATGLTVNELLKTNAQREREAKIAKEKQQIHKDTVKMLPIVTSVMGKLDTGLGIIEKISNILGDIVLDVFGVDFAKAEELILKFVKSDTFTTGLKNVLYFMKGVIGGIKDSIMWMWDMLKSTGLLNWIQDADMSGGYSGAQKAGNVTGKLLTGLFVASQAKKLLGLTPLTAMWVRSASGALKGLGKGIFNGIKGLFGGGGGAAAGGGSLPGQGSLFPDLVKHGKGFSGGGGGAAAMSGGQMLGYGVAAGFIAKGAYDVITTQTDVGSTMSEKAGALGGLGGAALGAKGGAMIGTMILPGIGTAIGAAIGAGAGYFGGQMVKHIEWFQDDLDKSRIKLVQSEGELLHRKTIDNAKLRKKQVEAANIVRQSFIDFGLTTDGITQNELRDFAQSQLDAGNITKEQFNAGLTGQLDPLKMLELAAAGAASQLGLEQQVRDQWVQDNMALDEDILNNYNEVSKLEVTMNTVKGLKDTIVDAKTTKQGMADRGTTPSDWVMVHGVFGDDDLAKVAEEMYFLYGGTVEMADIKKAMEGNFTYNDAKDWGLFSKTEKTKNLIETIQGRLEKGIQAKLNDAQFEHQKKETSYLEQSNLMKYDKATGALLVTEESKTFAEERGRAAGGLLQGPSHAEGGIDTKFGEMEGGEAVINKKSTAKYFNTLSRINQDQGGVAFASGGIAGSKFANGGQVDGVSGADKQMKNTYTVNVTKYLNARELGDMFSVPSHGMYPGHIQSRMVNQERAIDFGYEAPIDGDPTKYFVDPWDYGNRDTYADRDKTGKGIDTQSLELNYSDMNRYLKVAQTVDPSSGPLAGITLGSKGYNFKNQNCADYNARAFGVDANQAKEAGWLMGTGVTTPEMVFPLILEKYGGLGGRESIGDQKQWSFNSFMDGDIGDFTGLWKSDENPLTHNYLGDAVNWGNEKIYEGADAIVKNSSEWTGGLFDLDQTPGDAWDNTVDWNKKNVADPVIEGTRNIGNAINSFFGGSNSYWEDGGVTGNSPVSENQNQYFRNIPVTKVNDMILTSDGQMIETHEDDNIIAKKGGITQKTGGGGSGSANEMINLLRELIIVNKNAKIKVNSMALADAVNTANYMNT